MVTSDNTMKRQRSKDVKNGNARLERHTAGAFRGDCKKNGCGGKGTWGNPLFDWWEHEEGIEFEINRLQEILIVKTQEAIPIAAQPERRGMVRAAAQPERKGMVRWDSDMACSLRSARSNLAPVLHLPWAPSTTQSSVSMGATHNQTVTTRTFQDEMQALVLYAQNLMPEFSMSHDMAQLQMKKLTSKQRGMRNCSHPRTQNRNGVRMNQPGSRLGGKARCH